MRKIWVLMALALLVGGLTSAQAVGKDRTAREAKRLQAIHNFKTSARGQAATSAVGATARASGDFNHDGKRDVAVGVPGEDADHGAVHVFYGGSTGLKTSNDQVIRQTDWCGGSGGADFGGFGTSIAAGDFNGDNRTDLAVGVPGFNEGATDDGLVFLFYGHNGGFTPAADCQWVDQTTIGVAEENGDNMGATVAAGNFGGSSHDDLAIGVPGEDSNAGAVAIVYGSPTGLTEPLFGGGSPPAPVSPTSPQYLSQSGTLEDVSEPGDGFGRALDAGDLGRSNQADLAIGVPGEDVGATANAGAVNIVYGSPTGLTNLKDQIWTQDSEGVKDVAEEEDGFGNALVIGNFGKGGKNDLAVSVLFEDGLKAFIPGAVQVLYGSSSGIRSKGNQLWTQDSPGIPDAGEFLDFWGGSLAAGNVGKSREADLIIGAPLETPGSTNFGSFCPGPRGCAGQITVIYGSNGGLTKNGAKVFNQNSPGVPDTAEAGDEFGFAVAAGNYGKTSQADVVVGVPFEDIGATNAAGGINELFGTNGGLTGSGAKFFSQGSNGVEDIAEANDNFGQAAG
jgi:FG-GAP repeat protein